MPVIQIRKAFRKIDTGGTKDSNTNRLQPAS
jgi:hypothetical protein